MFNFGREVSKFSVEALHYSVEGLRFSREVWKCSREMLKLSVAVWRRGWGGVGDTYNIVTVHPHYYEHAAKVVRT